MREFMGDDFLLESNLAYHLYHDIAAQLPIIDFHNHLSAQEIWDNNCYEDIADAWLSHDHYKWRAMRSNGVDERYITGDAPSYDKYMKWCETVPRLIGSPLYHWNHLEMRRYFDYDKPLSLTTAREFWDEANDRLSTDALRPREIIYGMHVECLCTTDDPIDDLEYHKKLAASEDRFSVLMTFRPDKALSIAADDFIDYIHTLGEVVGYEISDIDSLMSALRSRIDYFDSCGCRISDHSLEGYVYTDPVPIIGRGEAGRDALGKILEGRLAGDTVSIEAARAYRSMLLRLLAAEYSRVGWTMQLHIGALRNNSTRGFIRSGRDSGYDSIDDFAYARELAMLLDELDCDGHLPKTIIYNLNPKDTAMLAALIGSFQSSEAMSKLQLGAGWWFLDHKRGMINQLQSFAEAGVLANFVGMVTDSRSMLSFTRHEYFRRILCNYIASLVEMGEYPYDEEMLSTIIRDICSDNIRRFSGLANE